MDGTLNQHWKAAQGIRKFFGSVREQFSAIVCTSTRIQLFLEDTPSSSILFYLFIFCLSLSTIHIPKLHSILQSSALQLPQWSHWFVKISEAAAEIGLQSEVKTHQLLCPPHCSYLWGNARLLHPVQHCRNRRKAGLIYIL